MRILDHRMFESGTIEDFNFWLASETEIYHVGLDSEYLKDLKSQIEAAIDNGDSYLNVSKLDIIYEGRLWDDKIFEVQWG